MEGFLNPLGLGHVGLTIAMLIVIGCLLLSTYIISR